MKTMGLGLATIVRELPEDLEDCFTDSPDAERRMAVFRVLAGAIAQAVEDNELTQDDIAQVLPMITSGAILKTTDEDDRDDVADELLDLFADCLDAYLPFEGEDEDYAERVIPDSHELGNVVITKH